MKSTNPRRIPVSKADVERARIDGVEKGLLLAVWTLADREMLPKEKVKALAQYVDDTADSITQGYISWQDIRDTLKAEYEVEVKLQ